MNSLNVLGNVGIVFKTKKNFKAAYLNIPYFLGIIAGEIINFFAPKGGDYSREAIISIFCFYIIAKIEK